MPDLRDMMDGEWTSIHLLGWGPRPLAGAGGGGVLPKGGEVAIEPSNARSGDAK